MQPIAIIILMNKIYEKIFATRFFLIFAIFSLFLQKFFDDK